MKDGHEWNTFDHLTLTEGLIIIKTITLFDTQVLFLNVTIPPAKNSR